MYQFKPPHYRIPRIIAVHVIAMHNSMISDNIENSAQEDLYFLIEAWVIESENYTVPMTFITDGENWCPCKYDDIQFARPHVAAYSYMRLDESTNPIRSPHPEDVQRIIKTLSR